MNSSKYYKYWIELRGYGIFRVVSCFPLHFKLDGGNFDYFLDSVPLGYLPLA